eukprot:7625863-Pyramimonas_sp.AAC.1
MQLINCCLFPQRRQAHLSQNGRASQSKPFWRDLFSNGMLELEGPLPAAHELQHVDGGAEQHRSVLHLFGFALHHGLRRDP